MSPYSIMFKKSTDKERANAYLREWRQKNKGFDKAYLERTAEHRREVKHRWYIITRRGGDDTPLKRGRPFKEDFTPGEANPVPQSEVIIEKQTVIETIPEPPKKTRKPKMAVIERKRRSIERDLAKIEERANAFRQSLAEKPPLII